MKINSSTHSYKWYAAYTDSRAEKKIFSEFIKKGIECYLPLKSEKRKWSDRIKTIEKPLISGYIFVKVSNKEFYDVLLTSGVRRYVSFEGRPVSIPEDQINDLKYFMQCLNSAAQVTSDRIKKGDPVRIVTGPLNGLVGEVVEIRGKRCIVLRFNNLGFCVHAELGSNEIELVNTKIQSLTI
jgi:transcription antitermination factor NusG